MREDYSPDGQCWSYLPHDHARSRAYRWGEDGLMGLTDREGRLCFALALWNGRDPILKERLFGLTGPEGNHGEDVKEEYYYLDSTPTHSYMKALYKYPHAEFPYARLVAENRARGRRDPEFELVDTGIFAENRYFDVFAEYAKQTPDDLFIRITVANRGPDTAMLHLLPTLWFRNTWVWGCAHEACLLPPRITREKDDLLRLEHETLKRYFFEIGPDPAGQTPPVLFTEQRDQCRPAVWHGQRRAIRQGRFSRIRGARPHGCRQSETGRHEGRAPLCPGIETRRIADNPPAPICGGRRGGAG